MSFIRYPGGKSKLHKLIISKLKEISGDKKLEYREPFFGGGSIGIKFLENFHTKSAWINDKDLGISRLWKLVAESPEPLKNKVRDFKPNINHFDLYKELLIENDRYMTPVDHGFMKLAIHQISYSGLGVKSGGPLGGRSQKSIYKVDCRWSPKHICKKIDQTHNIFKKIENFKCTSVDFEELISTKGEFLIYLDPPYYVHGNSLYQEGFSKKDHIRLAQALKSCDGLWLLSYDDCPEVRSLYKGWARIESVDVNYSITATKDKSTGERKSRKKPELLITNV